MTAAFFSALFVYLLGCGGSDPRVEAAELDDCAFTSRGSCFATRDEACAWAACGGSSCQADDASPPVVSCAPLPPEQTSADAFAQYCAMGDEASPWYEANNIEVWRAVARSCEASDQAEADAVIADAAAEAGVSSCARAISPREAETRGSLPKEAIRQVITGRIHDVRQCFAHALEHDVHATGRVTVRFVIRPDGRVAASWPIENETGHDAVGVCIADAMRRGVFDAPGGLVWVTYPFVVSSGAVPVRQEIVVSGARPRAQIRSSMRALRPEFSACFERRGVPYRGGGDLRVVIGADGRVTEAGFAVDPFPDPALTDCVLNVVRDTRFPAATAAVEVTYPLHFFVSDLEVYARRFRVVGLAEVFHDQFRAQLYPRLDALLACHVHAGDGQPVAFRLTLTLDTDLHVIDAALGGETGIERARSCMLAQARFWTFSFGLRPRDPIAIAVEVAFR